MFQPRKVQRSGLRNAVEGRVLIYIYKERMLADIEVRCPARHYVMVDGKLRILAAMKALWGERLTTVLVRRGTTPSIPETPVPMLRLMSESRASAISSIRIYPRCSAPLAPAALNRRHHEGHTTTA